MVLQRIAADWLSSMASDARAGHVRVAAQNMLSSSAHVAACQNTCMQRAGTRSIGVPLYQPWSQVSAETWEQTVWYRVQFVCAANDAESGLVCARVSFCAPPGPPCVCGGGTGAYLHEPRSGDVT